MDTINSFFDRNKGFAPLVLRIGISIVFIWFGWSGLTHTGMWTGLVPSWAAAIAAPVTLVKLHGLVELVFGILLLFGVYARLCAVILCISLLDTLFLVSGPTFIRDLGLFFGLVSLVLNPYQQRQ
jgi:uncharacterized membrane protein YphA (DoxX/SURF4 family)